MGFFCCFLLLTGCTTEEKLSHNKDSEDEDHVVRFDDSSGNSSKQTPVRRYKKMYGTKMAFHKKADPKDFFPENESYSQVPFEIEEEDVSWEGTDGSVLYAECGRIFYSTEDFNRIYDGILSGKNGELRNDFDTLCKGKELDGFSEEQALGVVRKITGKYGICVKNAQAFPLRSDVLLKLSKEFMSDEEYEQYLKDKSNEPMKRTFSQSDEAYLVLMDIGVGEHSLYRSSYDYGEDFFGESLVWAVVKRDRLAVFEAAGVYEVEQRQTDIENVLTQKEAEDALSQKYQDMILKDGLTCRKTELTYLAVKGNGEKKYEFIPVSLYVVTNLSMDLRKKSSFLSALL